MQQDLPLLSLMKKNYPRSVVGGPTRDNGSAPLFRYGKQKLFLHFITYAQSFNVLTLFRFMQDLLLAFGFTL